MKRLKTDYLDIFLLPKRPLADPERNRDGTGGSRNVRRRQSTSGVANFTVFQHQLLASTCRIPLSPIISSLILDEYDSH